MYQRFIAIGRLGRDPEVATTPGGHRVASLNLATFEIVKGEERTEWHRVVIWDEKLIEVVERNAAKGTMVLVEGQIRTRRWQARDGREVATTEVVLDRYNSRLRILARSRGEQERQRDEDAGAPPPRREAAVAAPALAGEAVDDRELELQDDLPF